MVQQTLPADAIRDTVDAVFRGREFRPPVSFWWWTKYLPSFHIDRQYVDITAWIVAGIAATILIMLVLRRLSRRGGSAGPTTVRGKAVSDFWGAASAAAARGDFAEAAHQLFGAVLTVLAGRGELTPHASKTLGDYGREFAAPDAERRSAVRAFLHLYERTAYGLPMCDAEHYARLRVLAAAAVGRHE